MCKVKMENNSEQKICTFFVVPGNKQMLQGMSDIEILNIVTINCSALGTNETDRYASGITNTTITQGAGREQCYTRQEAGGPVKCHTNGNSDLSSDSADKPMVNSNEFEYFLPGLNQDNYIRENTETTKQLQRDFEDVFSGIECFFWGGTFHCRCN